MCLIIHSNKGFDELDWPLQQDIFRSNPDGFGFAFVGDSGSLVAEKALYNSPEEISYILKQLPSDRDVIVHWRYATHSHVTAEQAHPFQVRNGLIMFHNGILSSFNPPKEVYKSNRLIEQHSDTQEFIYSYVQPALDIDSEIVWNEDFRTITEKLIGYNNKLVFLDSQGNLALYNYEEWVEYRGMLFSNTYAWPAWARLLDDDDPIPFDIGDFMSMTWEEIYAFAKDYPDVVADVLFDLVEEYQDDKLTVH